MGSNSFMSGHQGSSAATQQVSIKQEAGDPAAAATAGNPAGAAPMAGGGFVDSTTRQQGGGGGGNLADNAALSDLFMLQENNLKTGTNFLFSPEHDTLSIPA